MHPELPLRLRRAFHLQSRGKRPALAAVGAVARFIGCKAQINPPASGASIARTANCPGIRTGLITTPINTSF